MPLKDSTKIKEYQRQYRLEHKDHLKEIQTKWRKEHQTQISEQRKKRYHSDPKIREKRIQYSRARLHELQKKIKAIILQRGKCEKCGFSDVRALIVHHPLGNNTKKNICRTYKDIVDNAVPFSVICMNCHVIHHGTLQNTRFWS